MMECVVELPNEEVIKYAINVLRDMYPEDDVVITRSTAINTAVYTAEVEFSCFSYFSGECLDRVVAALARLYYELIRGHPLVYGNKRLATLVLTASLIKNGLTIRKTILKDLTIKAASGKLSFEGVYECLRKP